MATNFDPSHWTISKQRCNYVRSKFTNFGFAIAT